MEKGLIKLLLIFLSIFGVIQAEGQNRWETMDTFPVPKRNGPASFKLDTDGDSIPDKGFVFGGWDVNVTDYNDLWQFDPTTGVWTQKASLPSFGRRGPTSFVINNVAYVACGAHGIGLPGNFNKEVWAYAVDSNAWVQKNDFSGGPRWGMTSFVLNGSGYIVMGDSGSVNNPYITNDVWQYYPTTDSWVQMGTFPGSPRREISVAFTLDTSGDNIPDKAYIGYGQADPNTTYNDFWEYNPTNDHWTSKTPLPSSNGARILPIAFSLQNKGYMGMGCSGDGVYNYADLYQYDQIHDSWLRMADINGSGRRDAFCFAIGDTAYVGVGYNGTVLNDCHKYIPFLNGYNAIRGRLYVDANHSCSYDPGEELLKNWIVTATPGPYYSNTDSNGNYVLLVDSGTYSVFQLMSSQQSLSTTVCPAGGSYQVGFSGYGIDTAGFDFGDSVRNCPYLTVDINSGSQHRCQFNLNIVHYCNLGFVPVYNADIYVSLPSYVGLASTTYPYTINSNGNLVFHIDSVLPGECEDIRIIDSIDCAHTDYIGLTACVSAWITPTNTCIPVADSSWNHASLSASALCIGGDTAILGIANIGTGDMTDSTTYRIYLDSTVVFVGKVKLAANGTFTIYMQTNGQTVRIEVDEPANHPNNSTSFAWVEACGQAPTFLTQGFVTQYPTDPDEPERSTDCVTIDGAWDPNDKTVQPEGLTANHYVLAGIELNYKIRFQNTGNAPAGNILLIDTLSAALDPSTLRVTGCSHPYSFNVSGVGRPVLKFTFPNINLPDSSVSQLLSQGFATFSIKPYSSTVMGTIINNNAGIYFDRNPAVVTNTTLTTISDYTNQKLIKVLDGNTLVNGLQEVQVGQLGISLFPNPNTGNFVIGFTQPIAGQVDISLTDLTGRVLWSKNISDIVPTIMAIDPGKISKGIYLLNIRSSDISVTKKVAVE